MFHYNSEKQWKSKKSRKEIFKWARFYYKEENKLNSEKKDKDG